MWKRKEYRLVDKIIQIEKGLKKKLSPKIFNRLARETEFIQRIRKTEWFSIFWSIISGFVIGQATEIAGTRRSFIKDTGSKSITALGIVVFPRKVFLALVDD
jgi:hypothetical protein